MSNSNHVFWGDKIWCHCKSETRFMDYFTKSETFSAQLPFTYTGNKLYLHKIRNSLLITNINHNLGDSVAEGTVSEPKCHFQHWNTIIFANSSKNFKWTKNRIFKEIKIISHSVKRWKWIQKEKLPEKLHFCA